MSTPEIKTSVARQVELIIRQLNVLSTQPQVVAEILPCIMQEPFQRARLAEIVEADAALTASVLALAGRLGITGIDGSRPLAEVIDALPAASLRDAVLSVRVIQAFDVQNPVEDKRPLPRRQLALHALATACCAERIGEFVLDASERKLAFTAGLLHDIGKAALDEAMPKSFDQLVLNAQKKQVGLITVEQEHLGLTHSLLGKRLAEKWLLPDSIAQSIWLHHTDAHILSEMPFGRLAMTVALADGLARKCGIGQSGSYDTPDQIEALSRLLQLNEAHRSQIIQELPAQVDRRCQLLGLSNPNKACEYYEGIHQAAAQFARDNSKLSEESRNGINTAVLAEPVRLFLASLSAGGSPDQAAGRFALCLQKTISAQAVMVLIWPEQPEGPVEIAVADRNETVEVMVLPVPDANMLKQAPFKDGFALVPALEQFGWCVEQARFLNASQMLAAPLLISGKLVGVVFFQSEKEVQSNLLELLCGIGASAIAAAGAFRRQQEQAEQMLDMMNKLRQIGKELTESQSLSAIAEMAAGAAHELNNPLAVISGRSQLLIQSETDPNKKEILEQIEQRAREISDIVTDMMQFARPREPYKQLISPQNLIIEAIDKTQAALQIKHLQADQRGIDGLPDVFVDRPQVLTALMHILSNAMESYAAGCGPISIAGQCLAQENSVEIQITDQGCGMDHTVLQQAIKPFFSAKPAGRKRGMGLAHTQRLLALNGAGLHITSQPGKGTTVTIRLPRV